MVARLYVVYHNTFQEMASLNKIVQEPQEMAVDVLARIRPMIFNRGSLIPSQEVELGNIVKLNSKLGSFSHLKTVGLFMADPTSRTNSYSVGV